MNYPLHKVGRARPGRVRMLRDIRVDEVSIVKDPANFRPFCLLKAQAGPFAPSYDRDLKAALDAAALDVAEDAIIEQMNEELLDAERAAAVRENSVVQLDADEEEEAEAALMDSDFVEGPEQEDLERGR